MSDAPEADSPPESDLPWVAAQDESSPGTIQSINPLAAPAPGALYFNQEQNQFVVGNDDGGFSPIGGPVEIGARAIGAGNVEIRPGPDGEVIIGAGNSGAVRIVGDLLVEGSVIRPPQSPGSITLAAQSEPAHVLLFIHGDGKVDLGEPMTQAQVADLMAQRHMDTHVSTLMVVVSELLKVREELERLRNRIG